MISRLIFGGLIIGAVLFGLVANASVFLLDFTTGESETVGADDAGYAVKGAHAVGIRRFDADEAAVPMVVWYPALEGEDAPGSYTYAYAVNMLGAGISTALSTFDGTAAPEARMDQAGGPYPLVVLSHGFAIEPTSYGWLAEQLASHGFVVAAPFHNESLDPAILWKATIDRTDDVEAILEQVEINADLGLSEVVDMERVAVVGHSYGGYTAQVAGGARLDTEAFGNTCEAAYESDDPIVFLCDALLPRLDDMAKDVGLDGAPLTMWPDWSLPGVDAVVSIAGDAAMFGPTGLAEVDTSVLAIGGTADTDSPFEWGTRYTYDNIPADHKIEVALQGAGHMDFAGNCSSPRRILGLVSMGFCPDSNWEGGRANEVVKHYVTAFLLAELKADGGAAAKLSGTQDFADVGYRAEGY